MAGYAWFSGRSPAGAQIFRTSALERGRRQAQRQRVPGRGRRRSEQVRVGGRVENYSDFGSTADGKLTARFAPTT
jgi:hypothetical protein